MDNMKVSHTEAEHAANVLHTELENYEQKGSIMIQLAECGNKEQQHIKEQARLKGEISRLRYRRRSRTKSNMGNSNHFRGFLRSKEQ